MGKDTDKNIDLTLLALAALEAIKKQEERKHEKK